MFKTLFQNCQFRAEIPFTALSSMPPKNQETYSQWTHQDLAKLEQRCSPLQDLNEQTFDYILRQNARNENSQKMQESLDKNKKLENLMLWLLQSGNIDLAMLLFAQLESNDAQKMVSALTQQLQQVQAKRRELSAQMGQVQQGQQNSQSQLSNVQLGLQEVNDTLQMLTTLIKDVNDQKNRTIEFANNFLNSEHQTTMSLVRGMR